MQRPCILAMLILSAACGDDAAGDGRCVSGETRACSLPGGDPGVEACGPDFSWTGTCAPGADGGAGVMGPSIPWLEGGTPVAAQTSLLPCPDGFREARTMDDPPTCEPYPESSMESCSRPGEAHFPGEPGCAPMGPPCPADGLPADLPTDRPAVFVLAGAPAGGDGTRGLPYSSLSDVDLDMVPAGTIVALGRGTYDGLVELRGGVGLWGACVAETSLTSSVPSVTDALLVVNGSNVDVRNLRIADAARPGVRMVGAVSATFDAVAIENVTGLAFLVSRAPAMLTANGLVVRDTQPTTDGRFGNGLGIQRGGRVDVTRAVFDGNRIATLHMEGPDSELDLANAAVRATAAVDDFSGYGIDAVFGAIVSMRRTVFSDNRRYALRFNGLRTIVDLEDVIVRGTLPRASGREGGHGIQVQERAIVRGSRVLLDVNGGSGVVAVASAEVELADVLVRDTRAHGPNAAGVVGGLGARIAITSGHIARNSHTSVLAGAVDTTLALTDTVVRDTSSRVSDGTLGRGVEVGRGALVELSRVIVEGNREVGVFAGSMGTTLTVTDALVQNTRENDAGEFGRGLAVVLDASSEVLSSVFRENQENGVFVGGGVAHLELRDAVVSDTMGAGTDAVAGLSVQAAATVDATALLLERNRGVSVSVHESGTASLQQAIIVDALARGCADAACMDTGQGIGVGSYSGSALTLTDFRVSGAALCGVHVATDAQLDLSDGVVGQSAIGACVQVEGYDPQRLSDGVRYVDNDANLQATSLPVPEPLRMLTE